MAIPFTLQQRGLIEAGQIRLSVLARITIGNEVVRLWTGFAPLTWQGELFVASGRLAAISSYSSASGTVASGIEITLDGTALGEEGAGVLATLPREPYKGRGIVITYLVHALESGEPQFELPVFSGIIDQIVHREGASASSLVLRAESSARRYGRRSNRTRSGPDQRASWPGDAGFDSTGAAAANERRLYWGTMPPRGTSGAGGISTGGGFTRTNFR